MDQVSPPTGTYSEHFVGAECIYSKATENVRIEFQAKLQGEVHEPEWLNRKSVEENLDI